MNAHTETLVDSPMSPPMQGSLFVEMARKDWKLNQWPLLAYLVVGFLGLALLTVENAAVFHSGMVLLISAIVVVGAQLVFNVVINERSNKTLPFMLSLPTTFTGYTLGKLGFCVGVFLAAWVVLVGGIHVMTHVQDHLPAGMLPYYTITMGYLFVAFALTLAMAMIMESHVWAIVVMSLCNVSISIVMFAVAGVEGVGDVTQAPVSDWNGVALGFLGLEVLLIVAILLATLWIQSRKTELL